MTLELELARDHDRHRDAVIAMLRREFGELLDEHEREDIVQTAWLALIERERAGERVERPAAFLKTVAWRRARDRLRNAAADPVDPLDAPIALAPDDGRSPEEEADLSVDRALCRQVVETLSPDERAIVTLRLGWELKPREIQRLLGLRRARYNKLATRAMARLADVAEQASSAEWPERHRALLVACEAGTATPEERERAARLVREDPVCRAMLAELRGWSRAAAALAPLPLLFGEDGRSALARLLEALAVRGAEVRELAARWQPTGSSLAPVAATVAAVSVAVGGAGVASRALDEPRTPGRAAAAGDGGRVAGAPARSVASPARAETRTRRRRARRRAGERRAPARATRTAPAPAPRSAVAPVGAEPAPAARGRVFAPAVPRAGGPASSEFSFER